MSRRTHSFIWGSLAAAAVIGFTVSQAVKSGDYSNVALGCGVGIAAFTLVSCLILANNFVGEMLLEIFSWGFVRMPGLIFTLDLDGIIWLLTVKLLFWLLGIALALLCGILAIIAGLAVSLFVYPFAIYKNVVHGEMD